jgi:integrase
MARESKSIGQLESLEIERAIVSNEAPEALNDGGGLYLRRSGANWLWYLRATSPVTEKRAWFPLCDGEPYARNSSKASLKAARIAAESMRTQLRSGEDPNVKLEQKKAAERARVEADRLATIREVTVRALFQRWKDTDLRLIEKNGKRSGRKDGGLYVEQQFVRHVFPAIGEMQAKDVTRSDIMALLDTLTGQGNNRTANVILALLRQMFRFAAKRDIVQGDATFGIDKKDAGGKDTERERRLDESETRELAANVPSASLNPRSEAALWLLLATAARVGELMKTQWAHVDTLARVWTIPAENSKNGRAHEVQLSDFAIDWFERLAEIKTHPTWVFPNVSDSDHVCTKSLNKQFSDRQRPASKRMSNRTGNTTALQLKGGKWVPHDLRRTAATFMQSLGVAGEVIERCLNHTEDNKVKRIYQRDELIPQRTEAFKRLGEHLALLTRTDSENVVTLASRKRRA